MTKQDVLTIVSKDSKYLSYCKQVATGAESYSDLFQYCFLELEKKPEKYLVEKFQNGELIKIFTGIAYKSYNSTSSQFYKQYQKYYTTHTKAVIFQDIPQYTYKKNISDSTIKNEIEKFKQESPHNEYVVGLFNIYLECESCRAVGKKTGIPYRTIAHTIQNFKKEIKKRCQKYLQ